MNPAICQAISSRHVLRFRYQGGVRLVEPYRHGHSTAGNEVLRGFQISGYSHSGQPSGWKLFDVARISALEVTAARFPHPGAGYYGKDRMMRSVHFQVPSPTAPAQEGRL